jgi:LysM repeat protein
MRRAGKASTPEGARSGRAAARWLVGSSAIVLGAGLSAPALAAQHYVVRPGDFLYRIAAREGVSARALISANHLAAPYRLYPGEALILRGQGAAVRRLRWTETASTAPARPHAATAHYRVKSGDFLLRIAHAQGVSLQRLARANGLTAPYRVYAGATLTIPGRGGFASAQVRPRRASPMLAENQPPMGAVSIEPRAPDPAPAAAEPQIAQVVLPLYADDICLATCTPISTRTASSASTPRSSASSSARCWSSRAMRGCRQCWRASRWCRSSRSTTPG